MVDELTARVLLTASILLTAALSSIFLKRINFPYTIGLVIIGSVLGFVSNQYFNIPLLRGLNLSPDLILYIILPTLIFDAAINIDTSALVKNLSAILLLATVGLLISTGIIGSILSATPSLSFTAALLFGALISATDPVAVIALFKEIGAPRRLVTLIDGESLFNDATAIVLFTIVLASTGEGNSAAQFSFLGAISEFFIVLVGGLLIGGSVGLGGSYVLLLGKKELVFQISISFVMAYVSFVLADALHVSGVMSTLAAGLVFQARSESAVSRSNILDVDHFWDYFSFIANSFVFLLLGLTEAHIFFHGISFREGLLMVLIAIPTILLARAASIYLLVPGFNKIQQLFNKPTISPPYQTVLFWGGLRGAVPVALVLAIPAAFPHRELIIHLTFAFILFTLLVQGTTIKGLMTRLHIKPDSSDFADKVTVENDISFPNESLASLVLSRVVKAFDDEGFFIRKKQADDETEYLMKRQVHIVSLKLEKQTIRTVVQPDDEAYVRTVLYETLLELNRTTALMKDVARPEKLQPLVMANPLEPVKFNVMKFVKKQNLICSLRSTTKEDIIGELLNVVAAEDGLTGVDRAYQELMEREKTMSTGIGEGIALPHARTDIVDTIHVAIGVKPEGIEFHSMDGKPVKILALMLSPRGATGPHLQFLSAISQILSNPSVRENLIGASSKDELYRIFQNASK